MHEIVSVPTRIDLLWRESLVHEEGSNVLEVGKGFMCAVGQCTEDENTLSGCDSQPANTRVCPINKYDKKLI